MLMNSLWTSLKSKAPFWKKNKLIQGERWIEARESDKEALEMVIQYKNMVILWHFFFL